MNPTTPGPIGERHWAIAEGYIPPDSTDGGDPRLVSHEAACILNAGDKEAHVVYFKDKEPAGPYRVTVPPRRTLHLGFNDLEEPEPIPRDTPYASVIESDVPIVVQHSRLDTRQAALAVMTTVAYAGGGSG
ncbi:MAG: sensory rhodopsin transducer [Rhodanobacter sp.]|nr:MAG: sensory rhodopsin transducer [Rhodanobacter sp.]TAL88997.1 MAG: sensory rhodopsin transducer [Rhodanobacter sp.]TAM40409.1 MAG: sensory rhodopsin transducer [Rhodanobacter sp.]TAN23234.1 MAG: sensory rhodopsin transducer [Rhodanobacter sp.]